MEGSEAGSATTNAREVLDLESPEAKGLNLRFHPLPGGERTAKIMLAQKLVQNGMDSESAATWIVQVRRRVPRFQTVLSSWPGLGESW